MRELRGLSSADEVAAFETDVLAGFVLARASAGLADSTIRKDTGNLDLIRDWFGRPLWEMQPPVLLTARHDPDAARRFLTRAGVWVADRYDPDHGGIGLAGTAADPGTEIAYLLGAPYENGPAPRPGSYLATVITDLTAILPGSADLYQDMVNEFLAAGADPSLLEADERRAQWRPDGAGVTLTPNIRYTERLPPDGAAAAHHGAEPPPVPAWDALSLTSIPHNRHNLASLCGSLRTTATQP